MVIIILYNSENTSMRCCTKSYFDVTYCFGCKTCNSPPFLLKIGANEAYLRGVSVTFLNQLQPVFIGLVWSGFSSVFFFKKTKLELDWFSFFSSVWSSFDLFPVHRTRPSNPTFHFGWVLYTPPPIPLRLHSDFLDSAWILLGLLGIFFSRGFCQFLIYS